MHALKSRLIVIISIVLCFPAAAVSADWKPRPGWRDSYSVDGICYCDSSNFDHGIGEVTVLAPDGLRRSVRQICADIGSTFGSGASEGRIPYNTIACGNPPANNAPDEDLTDGCPGRVDMGAAGCFEIGPKWPLNRLYGLPMKPLDRGRWSVTASAYGSNAVAMVDGNEATRWTGRAPQREGQWIEVDLGGSYLINRVVLDSSGSPNDFPRGLSVVAVGEDGQVRVLDVSVEFEGEITKLLLPDIRLSGLRITQTGSHDRWYWSIHELHIGYVVPSN